MGLACYVWKSSLFRVLLTNIHSLFYLQDRNSSAYDAMRFPSLESHLLDIMRTSADPHDQLKGEFLSDILSMPVSLGVKSTSWSGVIGPSHPSGVLP